MCVDHSGRRAGREGQQGRGRTRGGGSGRDDAPRERGPGRRRGWAWCRVEGLWWVTRGKVEAGTQCPEV